MDRRFSIAPMMDWSDTHCRTFWRCITEHALLYTEMVTTGAILHAGPERFLAYNDVEHPVALQLGGSNPEDLAACARIAQDYGFDELNLNCGCPSDRVQNGMFGACLMAHPQLVADCYAAMSENCAMPVTIKHRIGIDDMESYDQLLGFVVPVMEAGCRTFIVHARKAWLQGLSPKQNREIPPLDYPMVYRLKHDFPELEIIINGGIDNLQDCQQHLSHADGVMLGRAAYHNPFMLAEVDQLFYGSETPGLSRDQILAKFIFYIEQQLELGTPLHHMTRHILSLFQGVPGAKLFRRHISQNAHQKQAGLEVVKRAHEIMYEEQRSQDAYRAANG